MMNQKHGEESLRDKEAKSRARGRGAAGVVVLGSRIMQLISFGLMAYMVIIMGLEFWGWRSGLGSIRFMASERNYSLAFYLGAAGAAEALGIIWCFWILTRKPSGGGVRLKSYDTGRGFIPFLLCLAVVLGIARAMDFVPSDPSAWKGLAGGIQTFGPALIFRQGTLQLCCVAGAGLSLIRKILRV